MLRIFKISCFVFCILFSSAVSGQQLSREIDAIQTVYQSVPDLSADFTQQTYVALIEKTVTKQGKFYFKKGGKLRIEYKGDEERNYVSDGTTLWIYVPDDPASMQSYELSEENVPKEALSFLSGFGSLEKEFQVTQSKAFDQILEGYTALHLKPMRKKAQYKSLDALFNQAHLLVKLKIMNLSGNITDYNFTNIKTAVGLKDNLFSPNPHKTKHDR